MRFSIVVINYIGFKLILWFQYSSKFWTVDLNFKFKIILRESLQSMHQIVGKKYIFSCFHVNVLFFILTQVFHHQWTILQLSLKVENLNSIFGITKTNIMLFLLFKVKCNKDIYKYGTTFSLISHNVMFIGP